MDFFIFGHRNSKMENKKSEKIEFVANAHIKGFLFNASTIIVTSICQILNRFLFYFFKHDCVSFECSQKSFVCFYSMLFSGKANNMQMSTRSRMRSFRIHNMSYILSMYE